MLIFSFKSHLYFAEFVKWILPFCPNIHTLKLHSIGEPKDVHNDIIRLKKLKDLEIETSEDLKEVTFVAFRTKTVHLLVDYQELPTGGDTSGEILCHYPTRFG